MATMTLLPMCIQCKKGVDGISPYNLVHDESDNRIKHHVHKKCFFCVKCECSLTITNAVIPHKTTLLVCPQDFFDIKYPKCGVCRERCIGEKVDNNGQSFHATCYQQLLQPSKSDITNSESISIAETMEKAPSALIDTTSSAEGEATADKDSAQISMTNSFPLMSTENSLPQLSRDNGLPQMSMENSLLQKAMENSIPQKSNENGLSKMCNENSLPQTSTENSLPQTFTVNSLPQMSLENSLLQKSMENSLPQTSPENSLPQTSTENSLPPMSMENSLPQISLENALPQMSMENILPKISFENSLPKISIINSFPQMSTENSLPQMLIENSFPEVPIENGLPNISLEDKRPQVKLEQGSFFLNPNLPDLMLPDQTGIFGMPMQHHLNPQAFFFNQAMVPSAKLHQQQSYQPNIFLNMHPTNMPIVSYPSNSSNYIHNIIQANNSFINNSMFTYPLNYPNNSFSSLSNIQPATIYNLTADPLEVKLNIGAKPQSTERKMKTQNTTHNSNVFNKKNSRITISQWQRDILTDMWNWKQFPSGEERRQLGESTGMHPRQVQIWFQNMRRKSKVDCQGTNNDVNVSSNS